MASETTKNRKRNNNVKLGKYIKCDGTEQIELLLLIKYNKTNLWIQYPININYPTFYIPKVVHK